MPISTTCLAKSKFISGLTNNEIVIDGQLVIPPYKPPAECILDMVVDFTIIKAVVIKTPLVCPEDTTKNLQKILILGNATVIVKYVAAVPDQQVHGAHFDIPFNALIEWCGGDAAGTPICVEPVIEKKKFCLIDPRKVFELILVRLDVYKQ
jgi:hypothetical protein